MKISQQIKNRLLKEKSTFKSNDNIVSVLERGDIEALTEEVQICVERLLDALIIDHSHDPNTQDTPRRVAKMLVQEIFAGRYNPPPDCTVFPNQRQLDEIYTLGPITVRSACSHHLVPITGKLWVGVIPSDRIIGISKLARLAEWVLARPQIQEEAIIMLADELEARINPIGLGLVLDARHNCMTWRGVRETETTMVTSIMRGRFREDAAARAELLTLFQGQRHG